MFLVRSHNTPSPSLSPEGRGEQITPSPNLSPKGRGEQVAPSPNLWKPTATIETLRQRADLLDRIRTFFKKRRVLEVETPLLSQHTVTDRYIDSFSVENYYLQTSPEYAMKRLLAANSGPIFQITKAFRKEECGRQHNPEFTLLEWYRPGFTHHDLMDEMDQLLGLLLNAQKAQRSTYAELFEKYCGIDPLTHDNTTELQLLFSEKIEPNLKGVNFVYDYPAKQAALSKINKTNPLVAERFEVYIDGIEIANGFHELTDAEEQQQRFKADQTYRNENNKLIPEIDTRFINALEAGLPDCAGVALGIDRLMMYLTQKKAITEVIAFDWKQA